MKRIGLIDNLSHINEFVERGFETASAEQILTATGGNTGNVAFVFAIRKLLANPITRIGWGWEPSVVRRQCDHIVVCCANQLGAHVDLNNWGDRLNHFGLPVTLIGIGAQADSLDEFPQLPPGTLQFLKAVDQLKVNPNRSNVSTRGNFTSRLLNSLGFDSIPTGCPSGLISPHLDLGQRIAHSHQQHGKEKIAIAAGNPWHAPSAPLERTLRKVVNSHSGEYIVQHPKVMLQLALGDPTILKSDVLEPLLRVYDSTNHSQDLIEWFRRNATIYVDAPNWIRRLQKFDAVLGPRFHGVMLGVQAGIPGWVISIDSRTAELAQTTGIPQIPLNVALSLSPEKLINSLTWGSEEAHTLNDARKNSASEFVDFFNSNEITPSAHLLNLFCNANHEK